MRLLDSHCHIQHDAFDADREEVIARTLEALEGLVVIGDSVEASRSGVALCRDRIAATVGIHPHHADQATPGELSSIEELALDPGVAAIGEIGLDYHYNYSSPAHQRAAFQSQLEMAIRLKRPVVIHCREAEPDAIAIIEPVHKELVGGVMHCFGGDAAFAERVLTWGFHISFAGNVTYPKAHSLRDAARIVPLDRLLVETDSPYLAPQPVRGKRCEPLHVRHTALFLADLKGTPFEDLARCTTENARRVYAL